MTSIKIWIRLRSPIYLKPLQSKRFSYPQRETKQKQKRQVRQGPKERHKIHKANLAAKESRAVLASTHVVLLQSIQNASNPKDPHHQKATIHCLSNNQMWRQSHKLLNKQILRQSQKLTQPNKLSQ